MPALGVKIGATPLTDSLAFKLICIEPKSNRINKFGRRQDSTVSSSEHPEPSMIGTLMTEVTKKLDALPIILLLQCGTHLPDTVSSRECRQARLQTLHHIGVLWVVRAGREHGSGPRRMLCTVIKTLLRKPTCKLRCAACCIDRTLLQDLARNCSR